MTDSDIYFPETQIIIFAREPVAGQVKTRLVPALGKQGACELYSALLDHTVHKIQGYKLASICLCMTPDSDPGYFSERYPYPDLTLNRQWGKDLGQRMHWALKQSLKHFDKVILVGTDCPFLNNSDLVNAIKSLDTKDMVFSPALDGGYVLVGARALKAGSFDAIEWGSDKVMAQTRQRLGELGISWSELREQRDIDEPSDLKYLLQAHEFSDTSFHIADIINRHS